MSKKLTAQDICYVNSKFRKDINTIQIDTQLFVYDLSRKQLEIYNRFLDPSTFTDEYEFVGTIDISVISLETLAAELKKATSEIIKNERIYDLRNQIRDLENEIIRISSLPKFP